MPNQEIMREWVARLRSGEYTQGTGKLRYTDPRDGGTTKHCCLGVLSDIAVERGVTRIPAPIPERITLLTSDHLPMQSVISDVYTYEGGNSTMPPQAVYAETGIPVGVLHETGSLMTELSAHQLAYLNDTGKTFAEIADVIEEHWIDLPEGTEVPDSPAAIEITEKEPANA